MLLVPALAPRPPLLVLPLAGADGAQAMASPLMLRPGLHVLAPGVCRQAAELPITASRAPRCCCWGQLATKGQTLMHHSSLNAPLPGQHLSSSNG